MFLNFLIVILIGVAASELAEGPTKLIFHVIRAEANDVNQLESLREIQLKTQNELDFWLTPKKVGHKADIMVDDEKIEWLTDLLSARNISYKMIIDDVEKLIINKEHGAPRLSQLFSKRLHNEGGNRARYPFGEYHSYSRIIEWLNEIQQKYPNRARVFTIGTTHEGRQIQGIKIGTNVQRIDKRIFWIDGGIHAREWAAVHTVLWFIDRLIADYDDDLLIQNALDKLNFYIVPVANPDGYEYSRSDVSPTIRLWRKNRAGVVCKKDRWFRDRCCGGVDLNRNFDWFFGEIGSSTDKCSEVYQGANAFSEAESRSIRDMIYSDEMRGKVDGFVTIHTYSQMWIHPFSHQRKTVPEDIADIERVGRAAVSALENTYGTKYKFGTGSDILYPSSGGSDDWAKGKVGAKYVYLLELRPGEDVWDGFILDQRQLIPTAKETWNGLKVVIKAVADRVSDSVEIPPIIITTTTPITTTTTATTTTTTATSTTTATISTTPIPSISSSVITSTAISSTTPKSLDAFYKFGKRRFKFVSIRTFIDSTTPMTSSSRHVTLPAFPPTFSMRPDINNINNANNNNNQIANDENDVETERRPISAVGMSRPSPMTSSIPAFVRRPNGRRIRPKLRNQQIIRRVGSAGIVGKPAFRNRSSSASAVVAPVQNSRRPTSPHCSDRSPWCSAWLSANPQVCQISSIYMRQDCARTCGFCRAAH